MNHSNKTTPEPMERVALLEKVIRSLLRDVVPHARDTGHNAADREMREAIEAARAAVPD